MNNANLPKISIITVSYNNVEFIEQTMQSVINQTYPNLEYIIIDGGSTDGSVDIIKKYHEKISYWVSERDQGIYDAMNKGIDIATGKYINFMNTGDFFCSNEIINQIFSNEQYLQADMIYGDSSIIYENNIERIRKAGEIRDLWKGMVFSHQSLFAASALLKEYKFNCSNRIGADFEFVYQMYLQSKYFIKVDALVASVRLGGLSDKERNESIKSHWKVVGTNSACLNFYFLILLVYTMLMQIIRKVFPASLLKFILRLKYSNTIKHRN